MLVWLALGRDGQTYDEPNTGRRGALETAKGRW
jgi:hypothetical protein